METIAKNAGFQLENHWVQTVDGYINLLVHLKDDKVGKPPVLLLHGLADSSDSWMMNGREKSIAFLLMDAGYDVWMGNSRTNKHSIRHAILNPDKDIDYWKNALMYDMAEFDIPSWINHVKLQTNKEKISVIAHSQATQQMFYNLIKNGSYVEANVNMIVAMSAFFIVSPSTLLNRTICNFFYYVVSPFSEMFMLVRAFPSWFAKPVFIFGSGYIPTIFNVFDEMISATTTKFND